MKNEPVCLFSLPSIAIFISLAQCAT